MSIARAFTIRNKRTEAPPSSTRTFGGAPPMPSHPVPTGNVKRMASVIDRNKISGPVELISTTNMLSYNAPDVAVLRKMRQTSSSASSSSENESDGSSSPGRSSSEETDASSVDSPLALEPNHLSCYFQAANDEAQKKPRRSASSANFHRKSLSEANAPSIPQRALSHSKSAHLQLARKRSMQTINSNHSTSPSMQSVSRTSSIREQARSSLDFFKSSPPEPNHPFGKELEKLSEVAEELNGTVRDVERDEDTMHMRERGLLKWSVDDYLLELQPLYTHAFGRNHPTAFSPTWI